MIGWSIVIHTEKWVRWPVENGVFVWTDGPISKHTHVQTHTHRYTQACVYTFIPTHAGLDSAAEIPGK